MDNKDSTLPGWYTKLNNNTWTEWIYRIVFSIVFFITSAQIQDEHYPDVCWGLILISIWLYFFKAKLFAFIPLLLAYYIIYVHVNIAAIL